MTTLNINKFRKDKIKQKKQLTAQNNRIKFGQTKQQKQNNKKQAEKQQNTDL